MLNFIARAPSILAGTSGMTAAPLSGISQLHHNYKSKLIYPVPLSKILLLLEEKSKQIDSITMLCVRACSPLELLNKLDDYLISKHTHTHKSILVYIHTYTNTQIHTHTYIHTYMHTQIHTHIYTHIHTYTHTYSYIHTYRNTYTHIYTHIYTYIHIHIHTRT